MIRIKHIFGLAVAASTLSIQTASAQYAVYPASQRLAKPAENSLFYSLPQNSYQIRIEIEETVSQRGIYSDYAEKMLKLPAIKENTVSYKIKNISIKTLAHPDPTQVYGVQGNLPALSLSPDGILQGVNISGHKNGSNRLCPTDEHKGTHRHDSRLEGPADTESKPVAALPVADLNIRQKFDTMVRVHRSDTMTVIEKILRPVVDEKSLAEQARKMADLIFKLQADKAELLSGLQEVAYPAGTMEFMYRQMEQNERNYLDCFTGTVHKQTVSYTFEVFPQANITEYPLAMFSPEYGIEPANTEEPSEDHLVFRLSPLPFAGTAAAGFQKENTSKEKAGGFYYRLPRKAKASIIYDGNEIESRAVFVSQWGEVLQLPVRSGYRLQMDGKSGGLIYFGPIHEQNQGTK